MEEHTQIKSRQCKGLSDPEGAEPRAMMEESASCKATMYGEMKRGTKFDDPGPDVTKLGRMEEEHTSRTR